MNSSQKNRIQAKNTNIVHMTWPNVYASIDLSLVLLGRSLK